MPTLERYPLFQLVWSMPATKAAAQFGISGNALGKICRAMRIPVPPRGYWAKVRHGHEPPKGSLPVADGDTVLTWEVDVVLSEAQREAAKKRAAEVCEDGPLPKLPPLKTELKNLHPLVVSTKAEFRETVQGRQVPGLKKQRWIDIRVSSPLLNRALLFLENLVRAAESHGIQFTCYADDPHATMNPYFYRCDFSMGGGRVPFHVRELPGSGNAQGEPELQLKLYGGYVSENYRWSDSSSEPLEGKMAEIVRRVKEETARCAERAAHEVGRWQVDEDAKNRLQTLERERQNTRRLNEQDQDAKAHAKAMLLNAARESEEAVHLQRFINRVKNRNPSPMPPDAQLWLQWAERIIAELQEDEVEPWKMRSFERFLPQLQKA